METGKMKLALSAGALALSMALAGCGGGGSSSTTSTNSPTQQQPSTDSVVEKTPFEMAQDAITAATTTAAVQTAIDAAEENAGIPGPDLLKLQMQASGKIDALATQALVTDAMSKIGLARTAVDELTEESNDDAVADAQEKIAEASTAVDLLPAGQQGSYNDQVRAIQNSQYRFVIGRAIQAAEEAVADLNIAAPTVDQIGLLTTANEELNTAIMALPEENREEYAPQLANFQLIATLAEGVRAGTATAETLQGRITGLNDDLNAANAANAEVAKSGAAAEDALEAYTKAEAAEKSAADAIKKLGTGGTSGHALGGTLNVKGDSAKAEEYAQKILMAVSDLEAQETAVQNAVKAIEEAIKAFEELDSNEVVNYDDRLKSLQDDLRSAKGYQTGILAINLDSEEYRVESQSGDRKPSAFADYVAEAIQDAFDAEAASATGGGWLRPLPANGEIATADPQNLIAHTNLLNADRRDLIEDHGQIKDTIPEGFKELTLTSYGAAKNLIGVGGVPLSSFTDYGVEEAEDGVLTSTDLTAILATDENARVVGYKGLIATLWCGNQGDCSHENGALKGPWYLRASTSANDSTELAQSTDTESDNLTPSSLTALYREIEGVYRAFEGSYVEYGYWLQGTDSAPQIITFAVSSEDASLEAAITNLITPAKATYKGDALGIAVVKTYDTNNNAAERTVTSRRSGHFTADVELNADFTSGAPNLEGSIKNFRGGVADPTWNVVLQQSVIAPTTANLGSSPGVAVGRRGTVEATLTNGDTREGVWSATFTGGSATTRPDAVHGGFGAYFPNGEAVGAYQAEKQD